MLIEQIIEFELRWPCPCSRTCALTTGYFYDKTKISKANLRVGIIYCLNIAEGNVRYFPLPGPNHFQNLTRKCKILNTFWTCTLSKRKIEQFNFFQLAFKC